MSEIPLISEIKNLPHPEFGYFVPHGTEYLVIWLVKIYGHFIASDRAQVMYQKQQLLWSYEHAKIQPTNSALNVKSIYRTDREVVAFDLEELKDVFDTQYRRLLDEAHTSHKAAVTAVEAAKDVLANRNAELHVLVRLKFPSADIVRKQMLFKESPNKITTSEELEQAWKQLTGD